MRSQPKRSGNQWEDRRSRPTMLKLVILERSNFGRVWECVAGVDWRKAGRSLAVSMDFPCALKSSKVAAGPTSEEG